LLSQEKDRRGTGSTTLERFQEQETGYQRVFVGWDRPLLRQVVEYSGQHLRQANRLELQRWLFVLPTAQAIERLKSLLQRIADQQGWDYDAPRFAISGEVAEQLYRPKLPPAIEFEQTLAWARVLRREPADALQTLIPTPPERDSLSAWLEIAGTLRKLATDLAAHDVSFDRVTELAETGAERQRWQLLSRLHLAYHQELRAAGLSDLYQERKRAVQTGSLHSDRPVALIGILDLNESVAHVLRAFATSRNPGEHLAFIAAPETEHRRFDSLGRLRPETFSDFQLAVTEDHLLPAGDVFDQASAVTEVINQYAARYESSEISIGVTDESHVAPVELQVNGCGWKTYRHLGWSVASTAIGRLLDLVSDFVTNPTWHTLAALVRHSDVHQYIQRQLDASSSDSDYLIDFDQLLADHFPVRLSDPLPPIAAERHATATHVVEIVRDWLSDFVDTSDSSSEVSIAVWCRRLRDLLGALYPSPASPSADDPSSWSRTRWALQKTTELLERFESLNAHLDTPVSAASALELLAGRMSDLRFGDEAQPEHIQIHGWLDLALDDAPAMVVCGLNHPFVPAATTSDPFLPGTLRSQLRIEDNERRFARDLYVMHLLLSVRDDIRFIVGKTGMDGSPTPPSRLLSAGPADAVAARIRRVLQGHRDTEPVLHQWERGPTKSDLPIPTLSIDQCPVKALSVTGFKAYLECPYRFYLRHVLKLRPIDDASHELAANQFGDLVHAAVEDFGRSDERDSTDEETILKSLTHYLHQHAEKHFGKHAHPSVQLQIRQAERRLQFVASEQAKRIAQGWMIHDTEKSLDENDGAKLVVDGREMGLRGRIDRIDRNRVTGQWAVLDYKTHGHKPEKKHFRKDRETGQIEWLDLQLPLYRLMLPFLGIDVPAEEVQLGYFNVSDKAEETGIHLAEFSAAMMADAREVIEDCVRRIFACDFAPAEGKVLYDDYQMILQTGVASRLLSEELTEEAD
jgi:hypothetical protein